MSFFFFFLLYPFWVYVLTSRAHSTSKNHMEQWNTPPAESPLWLPRQPGLPLLASPLQTPPWPSRQEFRRFPCPLPSPKGPSSPAQTASSEEGTGRFLVCHSFAQRTLQNQPVVFVEFPSTLRSCSVPSPSRSLFCALQSHWVSMCADVRARGFAEVTESNCPPREIEARA